MKKFLLKIWLILLPVLLFLAALEFHSKKNDSSFLKRKKEAIHKNPEAIEGLILGPSHIFRAINPSNLSYNTVSLAMGGNALNLDYIFLNNLKTIIRPKFVMIDLSQGYIDKSIPELQMQQLKIDYYFRIKNNEFRIKDLFFVNYPIYKYLKFSSSEKPQFIWGDIKTPNDVFANANYDIGRIKKNHHTSLALKKHNNTNDEHNKENTIILHKMIEICKNIGAKVIFLSPPKYYLYNNGLIEDHIERRASFLSTVVDNDSVYFWNYERFYEYETTYYYNLNHMNEKGAELFTKKINTKLENLLGEK